MQQARKLTFPAPFTSFHSSLSRSLLTQEGICLTLNPEFHFLEVAYPYVARRCVGL
jgi:predicted unusual protein kinase regulating ubiquinone biosynthesis (AarF/ABC1/UbiB family)